MYSKKEAGFDKCHAAHTSMKTDISITPENSLCPCLAKLVSLQSSHYFDCYHHRIAVPFSEQGKNG